MGPESEISGSLKNLKPEKWASEKKINWHIHAPNNTLIPIYLAHGAMDFSPITLPLVENKFN
jgi:hypothetical protein